VLLDVSSNQVGGPIPSKLVEGLCRRAKGVAQVQSFAASNNCLTGPFPTAFTECSALQSLDLNDNQIEGELPPGSLLGGMPMLNRLNLGSNNMHGAVPPSSGQTSTL